MKRTLGILLAIMMILSTVSFAAPSMTGVVNTAKEASDADVEQAVSTETAGLTAEDRGEPVLLREWTFDSDLEGFVPRNTSFYTGGLDGNGSMYMTVTGFDASGNPDQYAELLKNISYPTENITSIKIRIRKTTSVNDQLSIYYCCNGGNPASGNKANIWYEGSDWKEIEFKTSDFTGTWSGKFTGLRLDPGYVTKDSVTYYIDYVRFYGYHNFVPGINVMTGTEETMGFENLGETTFADGILYDGNGNKVIKCTETVLEVADSPVAGETGKALKITGHEDTTVSGEDWAYDSIKY